MIFMYKWQGIKFTLLQKSLKLMVNSEKTCLRLFNHSHVLKTNFIQGSQLNCYKLQQCLVSLDSLSYCLITLEKTLSLWTWITCITQYALMSILVNILYIEMIYCKCLVLQELLF